LNFLRKKEEMKEPMKKRLWRMLEMNAESGRCRNADMIQANVEN
jgi:hypothetical protein